MVDPDILEGSIPDVAHHHLGHEVAGMNISLIADVGHLGPGGAAPGIGQESSHIVPSRIVLQDLQEIGPIHGGIGGQDLDVLILELHRCLGQQADDAATLLVAYILIRYPRPPASGNQMVEAKAGDVLLQGQIEEGGNILPVVPGQSYPQAGLQARIPGVSQSLEGAVERPRNAPEFVMAGGEGGVQADPYVSNLSLCQKPCHLGGDQGAIGGYDRPQTRLPGVEGNREEVAAHQWLAASEDENRYLHPGQIVCQTHPFLKAHLVILLWDGIHITMAAGQVAASGQIPHHHRFRLGGEAEKICRDVLAGLGFPQGLPYRGLVGQGFGKYDHVNLTTPFYPLPCLQHCQRISFSRPGLPAWPQR